MRDRTRMIDANRKTKGKMELVVEAPSVVGAYRQEKNSRRQRRNTI